MSMLWRSREVSLYGFPRGVVVGCGVVRAGFLNEEWTRQAISCHAFHGCFCISMYVVLRAYLSRGRVYGMVKVAYGDAISMSVYVSCCLFIYLLTYLPDPATPPPNTEDGNVLPSSHCTSRLPRSLQPHPTPYPAARTLPMAHARILTIRAYTAAVTSIRPHHSHLRLRFRPALPHTHAPTKRYARKKPVYLLCTYLVYLRDCAISTPALLQARALARARLRRDTRKKHVRWISDVCWLCAGNRGGGCVLVGPRVVR